jgi:hypothetical protein
MSRLIHCLRAVCRWRQSVASCRVRSCLQPRSPNLAGATCDHLTGVWRPIRHGRFHRPHRVLLAPIIEARLSPLLRGVSAWSLLARLRLAQKPHGADPPGSTRLVRSRNTLREPGSPCLDWKNGVACSTDRNGADPTDLCERGKASTGDTHRRGVDALATILSPLDCATAQLATRLRWRGSSGYTDARHQ